MSTVYSCSIDTIFLCAFKDIKVRVRVRARARARLPNPNPNPNPDPHPDPHPHPHPNPHQETLGLINTYSGAEELGLLCNQLGERLEAECADSAAATLCYMCAANIAKVTELRQSHHPSPNPSYP